MLAQAAISPGSLSTHQSSFSDFLALTRCRACPISTKSFPDELAPLNALYDAPLLQRRASSFRRRLISLNLPLSELLGQLELGTETLASVAFDPAELGIERLQTTGGREKFDGWGFRIGRLVILHKGQVIEPAIAFPQPEVGCGEHGSSKFKIRRAAKGHAIPQAAAKDAVNA
jgi:hypothetical protein